MKSLSCEKFELFEKVRVFESYKRSISKRKIVTRLVGEMSRLAMDGQKTELFMEPFVIIRTMTREAAEKIVEECKRLDIQYYYDASQDGVEDWPAGGYEVEIRETGLKGQELGSWITARFNVEEQSLYTRKGLVMKDKHKPEWYNKNRVVIKARYERDAEEIVQECIRRNIQYGYDTSQWFLGCYRIVIKETGPKVRKLGGWAIRKFNTEERLKTEEGMNGRNVWIISQNEKEY